MGGIHPPLEVMLTWPRPNYVDPETRGPGVLITSVVLGVLTYIVVGGRIWARWFVQRNPGLDDWLMIAAMIPLTGLMIAVPLATDKYGFNRHVWDNPPRNYIPQRKLVMAIELLFVTSTGLIKLSVLLFYRRIVDRSISKRFIVINWISIGFVVAYIIAYVGLVFAACRPFSAFWDQLNLSKLAAGYKYECVDEGFHLLSATIISCVQDFIATTVPACLWWKITLPVRQKLALAAVFAIGYIVCLIATLRCYYIWKIFYDTWDVTWWTWPSWLLTIMEALVAAMCASAPALKVVLHRFFGSTIASASSSFGNTPRNWKDIKAWVTPRSHSGYANQSKDRSQTLELSSRSQIVMQKEITIVSTTDLNEYPADIEGQRRNSPTQFDMYPMRHPSY